jgi:hypothetical protein
MEQMDFKFLSIRNARSLRLVTTSWRKGRQRYDLLASKRVGFVAIAKGDVPQEHWFRWAGS